MTGGSKLPPAPKGTRSAGRRLWSSVAGSFELDEHELALLREIVRTVDNLDALAAAVLSDGAVLDSAMGGRKVHPALIESRQLRLTLARLVAALRLPEGDTDVRPQRRGAPRGTYG